MFLQKIWIIDPDDNGHDDSDDDHTNNNFNFDDNVYFNYYYSSNWVKEQICPIIDILLTIHHTHGLFSLWYNTTSFSLPHFYYLGVKRTSLTGGRIYDKK